MKVVLSGGKKTINIQTALEPKFPKGLVEFRVIALLEDVMDIYTGGDYFDRAVIFEPSWTAEGTETVASHGSKLRERVNSFAAMANAKGNINTSVVFVTTTEETAKLAYEETEILGTTRVILLLQKKLCVGDTAGFVSNELYEFKPELIYKRDYLNIDPIAPVEPSLTAQEIKENNIKKTADKKAEREIEKADAEDFGALFGDEDELDEDEVEQKVDVVEQDETSDAYEIEELDEPLEEDELEEPEEDVAELDTSEELTEDELEELEEDFEELEEDFEEPEEDFEEPEEDFEEPEEDFEEIDTSEELNEDELEFEDGSLSDFDEDVEPPPVAPIETPKSKEFDIKAFAEEIESGREFKDDLEELEETFGEDVKAIEVEIPEEKTFEPLAPIPPINAERTANLLNTLDTNKQLKNKLKAKTKSTASTPTAQPIEVTEPIVDLEDLYKIPSNNDRTETIEEVYSGRRTKHEISNASKETLNAFAQRGNSMVITGCGGCGTSFIAFNLANKLADLGYSVLLVDYDTITRTQSFISKESYDAIHSIDVSNSALKTVLSGNITNIQGFASIIRPAFHIIGLGLGGDVVDPKLLTADLKLTRFANLAKANYNFVIYDLPIVTATTCCDALIYSADNIVVNADTSTWGLMKLLLHMANIDNEDIQEIMFTRSQLTLSRFAGLKELFGIKIKSYKDLLVALDNQVHKFVGKDPGVYFQNLTISGYIPVIKNIEDYWFKKEVFSDTAEGSKLFEGLIRSIVLRESIK